MPIRITVKAGTPAESSMDIAVIMVTQVRWVLRSEPTVMARVAPNMSPVVRVQTSLLAMVPKAITQNGAKADTQRERQSEPHPPLLGRHRLTAVCT